jgi:hypothetical protein
MVSTLSRAIGGASAGAIRQWVRLTGKRVARREACWLDCPMGPPGSSCCSAIKRFLATSLELFALLSS